MTSFSPLSGGFSTALSGTVEPVKFLDTSRPDIEFRTESSDIYGRRIHEGSKSSGTINYTIVLVIISAIIFVTVVALYDVIRTGLNTYFANQALIDPNSHNTQQDIEAAQIANQNIFIANIVFAAITFAIAVIAILFFLWLLKTKRIS